MKKIKAISVKVDRDPEVVEIEPTYEFLTEYVGGYIEHFYPWDDGTMMILNEEGKFTCPLNRFLFMCKPSKKPKGLYCTDTIHGDFLIVGANEKLQDDEGEIENYVSLTDKQITDRMADLTANKLCIFYR